MKISARFSIALFLCLFAAVWSPPIAGQYRFDTWTTDNGLPQNGVRQITQTPEGYLWFTTFDGLVRFDGIRFSTFNKSNTDGIINNRFTGIFADTDGTVYATTMEDGVLTMYRNGVFNTLNSDQVPGHYIAKIEKTESGELRFLIEDEDRKGKSWYSLANNEFRFIEKEKRYSDDLSFTGNRGSRWTISTAGVREEKIGSTTFAAVDLAKVNFRANSFEDRDGGLWLGENRVHLVKDGRLRTFSEADGLPLNSIYHSFWQEPDGGVWFSSGGASSSSIGLVSYKEGKLNVWGKDHGLLNSSIQNLFHDREGTTWLATTKGISRLRPQIIQGYSTSQGLDHTEVYPLYRDSKNTIWIGTTKGLNLYRDGKFEQLELRPPSPQTPIEQTWKQGRMSVQSLWEDPNGKMWVGLNGGIYLVKDGIAEMLLNGSHVHAIKGDSHGNVWAATNKGVLRFNDYKLTAQFATKEGLPNEFMTFIFEDSKRQVWFGGLGGLSKFENGRFVNYSKNEGLVGNYIRTIHEDADGTLWIGTYDEGMSRYKDGRFFSFREENGLYSSGVFAIEEDEEGNFWISSNRGIYRVKRQELNDLADGKITKINSVGYGKDDGMLSNECNGGRQPASVRDSDGRMWFPTQEGVAVVDPRLDQPNTLPPTVVVENVSVERQPIDFRNGAMVEAGRRDLEIEYTGISLLKSSQVKFQYKLEGHDTEWIDAGTRRTAYYSYLPPGDYRFLVKAANSEGVWVERAAAVNISLKPFFHQTYTFYFVISAAAILLLLGIWKLSVYNLRARERKLMRLVAERTAELAEANEHLETLANSDGLTKIGNRRRFESFLRDEWHRAVRFKTEISLVMIDIDHFKQFNDTYGHQAGDECLLRVAEAFADAIKRPTDLVARFGGEEFALILGGTDSAGAITIARQAVENLNELSIEHGPSPIDDRITVSVGIATMLPRMESNEADLVKAADDELYRAKANGRNRMEIYDEMVDGPFNAHRLMQEMFDRVN